MKTQDHQITLEELAQLDKELANEDFESTAEVSAADLAGKLKQICTIYKKIKPVLGIVLSFPLIPSSVKAAVKAFMKVLDTVCA